MTERDDIKERIIKVVDRIAVKYNLEKDKSTDSTKSQIRYYGEPYHYYSLEIKEQKDKTFIVVFIHEARMSSKSIKHDEPEKEFLEELKRSFHENIIKIESNIN